MRVFLCFLREEVGAITIDWVTLTAAILLAGMVAVFTIFSHGVRHVVAETNQMANAPFADTDPGRVEPMGQ